MNEEEEEEGRPMTEDGLSIGENGLDDCGKNFGEWLKIPPKGRKDEKNWAGGREEEERATKLIGDDEDCWMLGREIK